ncbi:type II toxin-antitoxin system Phd/YefM family antitoxin [Azospirillum halopraeferens]|uniref:type II toxin-antitoxin system Phd/YefM family antitoxin n=1 Tax=Azospirillum halopraeferens TaxID=34010 RepID=UPI00048CD2BA|nr:type II toxin-antitoxin system Phd/YefM family antitoxin [Azospirillum halopraeferens]
MPTSRWSLRDARNRFSAVVEAALAGEPQHVTRHGRPAVVVVAAETFERLHRPGRAGAPSFAEMLLAMPRDDGSFERSEGRPRAVEI